MTEQRTYREIAKSWELWCEHIDPGAVQTREDWDACTIDERIAQIVACFGPEPPIDSCVLVRRSESGTYQIIGEPEDWAEVCQETAAQTLEEPLLGWGQYRSAWRVLSPAGAELIYFRSAEPPPAEHWTFHNCQTGEEIRDLSAAEVVRYLSDIEDDTTQRAQ